MPEDVTPSSNDAYWGPPITSSAARASKTEAPPRITDDKGYDTVPAGKDFLDPEGNLRTKPWMVKSSADFDAVPEGADFIDPEGNVRTKPKYEGIDFTSQTLYDMALTDKEREKALARSYPGKVKKSDSGDLYVEDDGVLRKPGRGGLAGRFGAGVTAAAMPTAGAALGTIGGGAAGSIEPGGGTVLGAAVGGASGATLGQSFNDMILQLAGVYDRTPIEEAGNLGAAALTGGAGVGVGRGIAAVAPAIKGAAATAGQVLPKVAAKVLGADPERLSTARGLANEGVLTPPSSVFMEAPYLHTAVEVFDPKFRTQNVLQQSAENYYERKGGSVLESLGVPEGERGSLADPKSAVSSERAGTALLQKSAADMAREDAGLQQAIKTAKATAIGVTGDKTANYAKSLETLRAAEESSRKAAQTAIDAGFKDIQTDVDKAVKAAGVGQNSGELWRAVGEKFRAENAGIKRRASKMYNDAHEMGADYKPNIEGLSETADEFAQSLPDTFKQKHPDIVRRLSELSGVKDPETGERVKEPSSPTFGQLHNLRSMLRSDVDYHDLTPSIREGAYKYFATAVDRVIHDANAIPQLKTAAEMLDAADKFYSENMAVFRDRNIQSVVSGLKAGEPADPEILAQTLLRSGRTDLIKKAEQLVGPNLWAAVKAFDVQEMLNASRTLVPGQIDGRAFASQVLDRVRSGMLETVHGPQVSDKLRAQAQYVAMIDGKLPMTARPGDTVASLIQQAKAAADAAKEAAKTDPLGTLTKEMKGIDRDAQRQSANLRRARTKEPLGFLYDPTTGATEAADRILKSKDLIFAAASKFGEQSPEFNMLRQVYAQRVLQGTLEPGKRLEGITPEIQRLMFPGASLEEMQTLAKNMDFLMGSRAMGQDAAGSSIAAQTRVLNPWGSITGLGKFAKPLKIVPGMETLGRFILAKYYQTLSELVTRPAFLQWVAKGLDGGPVERSAAKAAIQKATGIGGPIGAGAGEAAYQQ